MRKETESVVSSQETPLLTPQQTLENLRNSLRPGQRRMADWRGGPLAVSAVPGSGKSTGMAIATAILLAERQAKQQAEQQEGHHSAPDSSASPTALAAATQIILVTFTRSAAANLRAKIRNHLRQLSLPGRGFSVYTLHSLALNIATRHPNLSGLNLEQMTLVSPNQNHRLIRACVEQWIATHPKRYQRLLEGQQFDGEETERLRRQSVLRTEVLPELANIVIHEAKSSGLMPAELREIGQMGAAAPASDSGAAAHGWDGASPDDYPDDYDVLAIAADLYQSYQELLSQRGFLDYDDMVLAALRALVQEDTRTFWQSQILAVFEDEAQDSSPLQTRLLEILAGGSSHFSAPSSTVQTSPPTMNLVRVGDPNQAINSTFTPADPVFFRQFCDACRTQGRLAEMTQAGRSTPIIMEAANATLDWINQQYPFQELPFRPQAIQPVAEQDPQPQANPPPEGRGLEIYTPDTPRQSVDQIAQRVARLLTRNPDASAAILVRENRQGQFISRLLQQPEQHGISVDLEELGIEVYNVGQRDRDSHIPGELLPMLQFLNRPHSPDWLKAALSVLMHRRLIPSQDLNRLTTHPEQFLYPSPLDPPQLEEVAEARRYCSNLLRARIELPHYQLIPFLALTLRYDQAELATADKLAERIARQTATDQSLTAILEVLNEIVRSEKFDPVDLDDPDTRYTRSRQLTIITMHKAKGLDWDFVFLPFLHEHMIPGSLWVPPQRHFLGHVSLAEVARAQIRASLHGQLERPTVTQAWERAGQLKIAEEFRLLYVAMTRAKRLLWMAAEKQAPFTWNKPDSLDERTPCPVIPMLQQRFFSKSRAAPGQRES